MPRWLLIPIAFTFTGCFNGFLVRPVQCDGPLDENVIYCAKHCLCKDKIAVIDVDGVLMNSRTTSSGLLGGSGENPVSLFREKLDMARGVRLARAAYESRMKQAAPPIVEAHFERNSEVLEHYTREQLDAVP